MRQFEYYLKTRIVRKRSPQLARAKSLIEEAEQRREFLLELQKKIPITDSNANYFIEQVYDILIELARAILLLDGYSASGDGAHEAEIAYLDIAQNEKRMLDDLRERRNKIKYQGKEYEEDYARLMMAYCKRMYPIIQKMTRR